MSSESHVTRITAAAGWVGLVLFLGWQEFVIETEYRWITPWWFRIPATAMLGLVVLVLALECIMQEMTVRRWATSALVFAVFGLLFLAAGIIDPEKLQLSRWLLILLGIFYLAAAGASGVGAKDSM
jgi:peptidoglycan/LPS O-acetylase OafA/YrhL